MPHLRQVYLEGGPATFGQRLVSCWARHFKHVPSWFGTICVPPPPALSAPGDFQVALTCGVPASEASACAWGGGFFHPAESFFPLFQPPWPEFDPSFWPPCGPSFPLLPPSSLPPPCLAAAAFALAPHFPFFPFRGMYFSRRTALICRSHFSRMEENAWKSRLSPPTCSNCNFMEVAFDRKGSGTSRSTAAQEKVLYSTSWLDSPRTQRAARRASVSTRSSIDEREEKEDDSRRSSLDFASVGSSRVSNVPNSLL